MQHETRSRTLVNPVFLPGIRVYSCQKLLNRDQNNRCVSVTNIRYNFHKTSHLQFDYVYLQLRLSQVKCTLLCKKCCAQPPLLTGWIEGGREGWRSQINGLRSQAKGRGSWNMQTMTQGTGYTVLTTATLHSVAPIFSM